MTARSVSGSRSHVASFSTNTARARKSARDRKTLALATGQAVSRHADLIVEAAWQINAKVVGTRMTDGDEAVLGALLSRDLG